MLAYVDAVAALDGELVFCTPGPCGGWGTGDVLWDCAGDVAEGRAEGVVCWLWDHGGEGDSEQCVDLYNLRRAQPEVWVSGRRAGLVENSELRHGF